VCGWSEIVNLLVGIQVGVPFSSSLGALLYGDRTCVVMITGVYRLFILSYFNYLIPKDFVFCVIAMSCVSLSATRTMVCFI
jgi:hypothetical protein